MATDACACVLERRGTRRLSDAQKRHVEAFRRAIHYAKGAQGAAEYQAAAEARGLTAFNVAVADFLHAPEIQKIDLSCYHGKVAETIAITAVDNVKVKTVSVTIVNDDGSLVEKGAAVAVGHNSSDWRYVTTCCAASASVMVVVEAADLTGQVAEVSQHSLDRECAIRCAIGALDLRPNRGPLKHSFWWAVARFEATVFE